MRAWFAVVLVLAACDERGLELTAPSDAAIGLDAAVAHPTVDQTFADLGVSSTAAMPAGSAGPGLTVLAADLDGDSHEDLVVMTTDGAIESYRGDGKGGLALVDSIQVDPFTFTLDATLADLDGDGDLDLVVADQGQSAVVVFRNDASAASIFSEWERYPLAEGLGVTAVAVGDVDEDGRLDLVASAQNNSENNPIFVLLGQPDHTFAAGGSFIIGHEPTRVALADLDRDGHLDAIALNVYGPDVAYGRGDGHGSFATVVKHELPSQPFRMIVGDLDGDSNADVIVAGSYGGVAPASCWVDVLFGDGEGSVRNRALVATDLMSMVGVDVRLGDFDRDGAEDLAMVAEDTSTALVALGDGVGGFRTLWAVALDEPAAGLAVADFDEDGTPDLVAGGMTETRIYLLRP